jgi:hypothetical protein
MFGPIPYIWGPHHGPPMVEGKQTHNTWNVGPRATSLCPFLNMGYFI